MALPPLLVKIGADATGLDKGLSASQASLAKFAKAGVASVAAVGVAMIALTKQSLANIDVLAKQARSLGLTTAALQKMSLVANEAGVETGKLSSMLGLMQRNIVELQNGTAAQIDTFKALGVSISDLQGLEPDTQFERIADALSGITDPAEKTALAMEVFGRSGRDAINMLDGYASAAANAEAFQLRFGITVGQDVSQNVERANDAVGRLGMVMTGLGNQMAGVVAPAIERFATALIDLADAFVGANVALEDFLGNQSRARAILGEDVFNALNGNTRAVMENADALSELATILGILQGPLSSTANTLSAFADQLRNAGNTGAEDQMMALVDQIEALDFQLQNGGLSLSEYETAMNGVIDRAESLLNSLRDVSKVGYNQAIANLRDLRTALQLAAQDAFNLVTNLPGADVSMASGPTSRRGHRAGTTFATPGLAPTTSIRPQLPGVDFGQDPDAQGGGGGGGKTEEEMLREQMARRLEVLMEGLMTERETVAQWYDEGKSLIQNATDAELEALGGKHEAMQRLEKEHQSRLSRIRQLGAAADLSILLGAGQEVLSAMGTHNKKALKVAQVFGAAQALISAYQGAAEALKLPFPANIAAAATVLAKGIGFVSAIKGVNASGGGSTASSGGSSTATAPASAASAPAATQTLNFSVTNDPFGISDRLVRQIVGAINQSQRDGSTLIRATVS